VVDHQVVGLEYEGGLTATFTMTAFHPGGRFVRVHGTKGYIHGDIEGNRVTHSDFISGNSNTVEVPAVVGGHGGGDYRLLRSLTDAIRVNDASVVLTTTQESLNTHRVVFAAEQARLEGRVVDVADLVRR